MVRRMKPTPRPPFGDINNKSLGSDPTIEGKTADGGPTEQDAGQDVAGADPIGEDPAGEDPLAVITDVPTSPTEPDPTPEPEPDDLVELIAVQHCDDWAGKAIIPGDPFKVSPFRASQLVGARWAKKPAPDDTPAE